MCNSVHSSGNQPTEISQSILGYTDLLNVFFSSVDRKIRVLKKMTLDTEYETVEHKKKTFKIIFKVLFVSV